MTRFTSIPEYEIVLNGYEVPVGHYPAGEPVIDHGALRIFKQNVLIVRSTLPGTLMAALWLVDAMAERGHKVQKLVLPFLPGARQDRLNNQGDYLFTGKSIANEINRRGFEQVACFDPHSDFMPGHIDRCKVVHVYDSEVLNYLPHFDFVVSPDAGAVKRAEGFAQRLNLGGGVPVIHGWKTRDPRTNRLTGVGVENHPDVGPANKLLVVDDICDGGSTFLGLADAIHEVYGPNLQLNLWVSHGLFTQGYDALFDKYHGIYTTNSTLFDDSIVGRIDDGRVGVYNILDDL